MGVAPVEVPLAPPDPRAATQALGRWLDRAVAVMCVSALVPVLALAHDQLQVMHLGWLVLVGGTIAATSVLMPVYAWSDRGMTLPAALYALAVFGGLVTWPLAWVGAGGPTQQPWLWVGLIIAGVCTGAVFGHRVGVPYLVSCAIVYLGVRMLPSGGGASPVHAVADTLLAVAQPGAVMVCLHFAKRAIAALDDRLATTSAAQAETAVKEALLAERGRLDGIVHDEVMTTLVAAARGRDREAVAGQARAAIASLKDAAGDDADQAPLRPDQFEWLIRDVVHSVAPTASVTTYVSAETGLLPPDVVTSVAEATREACLNAAKHAHADTIEVALAVAPGRSGPRITVDVVDDGVGFDPGAVSTKRLGLRVSVRERLRSRGGEADVRSAPGEGTRVSLVWEGRPAAVPGTGRATANAEWQYPVFSKQPLAPFGLTVGALMTVYTVVGILSVPLFREPLLAAGGILLLGLATPIGLARFGFRLSEVRAWTIISLALAATLLALLAMAPGTWPGNFVWFSGAFSLLLVLVRGGGRAVMAWVAACLFGIVVLVGAAATAMQFDSALASALGPLIWMGIVEFFITWLRRLRVQLVRVQAASHESAAANAAAFSQLMLREVWLADLRDQVAALLEKVADPRQPLSDADRELCLVTEATLRDNIRAFNLTSPTLAAAIVEARRRGVQVTLVDNRGSVLPENVRRAALKHLETVVRSMRSGRLVARTAPEGYDEAVTIVAVDTGGEATMTTIDNDGAIAVRA